MPDALITPRQLRRLQTLWGLLAAKEGLDPKSREPRLAWCGAALGHYVESFKLLTAADARALIDKMQACLPPELIQRRRRSRERARAAGTEGRRLAPGRSSRAPASLPDAQTLDLVRRERDALGWSQERLEAFLRSRTSPTRGRAPVTLADWNRVLWALRGIHRRQAKATLTAPKDSGPAPTQSAEESHA